MLKNYYILLGRGFCNELPWESGIGQKAGHKIHNREILPLEAKPSKDASNLESP